MGEAALGSAGRRRHGIVVMDLPGFYREQARLYWQWRATRLALVRRVLLSWIAAGLALLIVATVSSNLTLDGPVSLVVAALSLAVLNLLARPFLLLALSPLPAFTVQVAELLVEVVIVLAIGRFVPGVGVGEHGRGHLGRRGADDPERAVRRDPPGVRRRLVPRQPGPPAGGPRLRQAADRDARACSWSSSTG